MKREDGIKNTQQKENEGQAPPPSSEDHAEHVVRQLPLWTLIHIGVLFVWWMISQSEQRPDLIVVSGWTIVTIAIWGRLAYLLKLWLGFGRWQGGERRN